MGRSRDMNACRRRAVAGRRMVVGGEPMPPEQLQQRPERAPHERPEAKEDLTAVELPDLEARYEDACQEIEDITAELLRRFRGEEPAPPQGPAAEPRGGPRS